ncbi:Protein-L-isoaspartate O-methyltransferase [Methylobrevis pamukkalensis]|uniref:Protein-L-isoaspartate O-methyltransferase n=1 Tax=Methylobrevis pamukkalensis TaxID=1439726 RepID=A0A1E3H3F1_9HYPH|nr:protein-L-isoaspartate O-methyltransferase [Methylobrevis pamukkalensis]ODN70849.1 Protein-L-isoaspartate O-methyltransferase [Methylobrevis pamukkalensis]
MVDFANARTKMVDGQVRPSDVTDYRIISAMLEIPREVFVPPARKPLAYTDMALKVAGEARSMLPPRTFAMMVQAADIQPTDVVLDLGCASGYSSAVIAKLASSVVAVEQDPALVDLASKTLLDLGIDNVAVVQGQLVDGLAGEGPYDVIMIEGAVDVLPDTIGEQLKDGGRLVVIEGRGQSAKGMLYVRTGDDLGGRIVMNAGATCCRASSARPPSSSDSSPSAPETGSLSGRSGRPLRPDCMRGTTDRCMIGRHVPHRMPVAGAPHLPRFVHET